MIVDSSALLAVTFSEPDARDIARCLLLSPNAKMSIAAYVEVALRLDRLSRRQPDPRLDEAVRQFEIALMPLSVEQGFVARRAFAEFGGAPAKLNFGDCLTYALAKTTGEPLLFKGNDFIHTDLPRAIVGN